MGVLHYLYPPDEMHRLAFEVWRADAIGWASR
jgi:hypothetical protein